MTRKEKIYYYDETLYSAKLFLLLLSSEQMNDEGYERREGTVFQQLVEFVC